MADGLLNGLAEEMGGAKLGDKRRSARLRSIVGKFEKQPSNSIPVALETTSAREGAYRFFSNSNVTMEAILEPHQDGTSERAKSAEQVLVLHDTTYFSFSGDREGMGRLHDSDQGFWGHFAVAVGMSSEGEKDALGVIGVRTGTRYGPSKWKGSRRTNAGDSASSEPERWPQLVDEARARLASQAPIHVMDREADDYALLAHMVNHDDRFVVRLEHDRLTEDRTRISTALDATAPVSEQEIKLPQRQQNKNASTRQKKRHPSRKRRTAKVQLRTTTVHVRRPDNAAKHLSKHIAVHVVEAKEVEAPAGEEPLHWRLITTEPIDNVRQVERIITIYRGRWVIEEFFKSLKTGCAFEKRQLGSADALHNALGVLAPIACKLLRLRDAGRRLPNAPAERIVSALELQVLAAIGHKPLSVEPTVEEVMYAIAALGGHIRNNGAPGWLTLGRGYQQLRLATDVWQAARKTN